MFLRANTGIRLRLALLLLVVLLPVILVQLNLYNDRYNHQLAEEYQANLEMGRAVGKAFDAYVRDVLHQEYSLAQAITKLGPVPPEDVDELLATTVLPYPSVRDYYWVGSDGRLVASSYRPATDIDPRTKPYLAKLTAGQEWIVSDLLPGETDLEGAFDIAYAARDTDGRLLGMVVARVDPSYLDDVLGVQRGTQGAVVLIDGKGRGVYRYPEMPMPWQQRDWIKTQPIINEALSGREVTGTFVAMLDGSRRVGGWVPIASMGWVASASRPEGEITAPILADFLRDSGLFALLALAAALLGFGIARSISRPIGKLRAHAIRLGEGQLDERADLEGPAEVEDLASAFNRMASELKWKQEKLRSQNEELQLQQQELQTQNEELQSQEEELLAQNEALQAQAERLRQLERTRDDYIRTISHDLRNPLTNVLGLADVLRRVLAEKGLALESHSAETVVKNAKRMNAMIQVLVESARLEAGNLDLRYERIDLASFVKEVVDNSVSEDDRTRVIGESDGEGIYVNADRATLERALVNLVSNALKYSEASSPVVVKVDQLGSERIVSVFDKGIGIPPEEIPKLFERYHRSPTSLQREGLGLGLYIVRLIAEAHGGRVSVTSEVGKGSTFRLTLPGA